MQKKQQLGQFFTTNVEYILQGFASFVTHKHVVDPFAGAGDLLQWAKRHNAKTVQGYDIDKKWVNDTDIVYNDSLANPVQADFMITNPPYLYQNKMQDNTVLAHSKHTDLYHLSLEKIMNSAEGIAIVPINFLSSDNAQYIRTLFLETFEIVAINYFTEQVFDDTTYNVMAFYYQKKPTPSDSMDIRISIFPEAKTLDFTIYKRHNWKIGGEFMHTITTCPKAIGISRLEEHHIMHGDTPVCVAYNHLRDTKTIHVDTPTYETLRNNIIVLKCIDTGTENGKICLQDIRTHGVQSLIGKRTSRNQAHIIFSNPLSIQTQHTIITQFNALLNTYRDKYYSLFLTNFRDNNRKRLSFTFCYKLINYVYYTCVLKKEIVKQ